MPLERKATSFRILVGFPDLTTTKSLFVIFLCNKQKAITKFCDITNTRKMPHEYVMYLLHKLVSMRLNMQACKYVHVLFCVYIHEFIQPAKIWYYKSEIGLRLYGLCDNYVPQWWVEYDNELSWLFTKRIRAFYLNCRK